MRPVIESLESEIRAVKANTAFLLSELTRVQVAMNEIVTRLQNREIEDHIKAQFEEERVRLAEKLNSQQQPLAQSRASWPRMKKLLEENDVKNVIAAQRAADQDFIGLRRESRSDHLERYWQDKQANQPNQSDSQEKGK